MADPTYQINSLDAQLGHAEVTFTADDGKSFTEVMGDLPLDDADATKQELSRRCLAWQNQLYANEQSNKAPAAVQVDEKLEDILLQPQKLEPVDPPTDAITEPNAEDAQITNTES